MTESNVKLRTGIFGASGYGGRVRYNRRKDSQTFRGCVMKTKVTEQGVLIPKKFLKGIKEVEIRREDNMILVVPVVDDPILRLGEHPVTTDVEDASENHDAYIYTR